MALTIELSPRALRDLGTLEKDRAKALLDALKILQTKPWPGPPKVKKLAGHHGLHRLRVGDHRAIFEPTEKGVVVLRVLDRKDLERIIRNL